MAIATLTALRRAIAARFFVTQKPRWTLLLLSKAPLLSKALFLSPKATWSRAPRHFQMPSVAASLLRNLPQSLIPQRNRLFVIDAWQGNRLVFAYPAECLGAMSESVGKVMDEEFPGIESTFAEIKLHSQSDIEYA